MKKIWAMCLLVMPFICNADIGTITEQVNNPPTIARQKATLTGSKGTSVEMNDAINTKQGKVGIVFRDDTRVQINENSKLVIDEFVQITLFGQKFIDPGLPPGRPVMLRQHDIGIGAELIQRLIDILGPRVGVTHLGAAQRQ